MLEQLPESDQPDMRIFNKFGQEVLYIETFTPDSWWNGCAKNRIGNDLPEGTYYFINRLSIENNELLRGDITIIRD